MNLDVVKKYCHKKKCVTEDMPFDESTLVIRVGGKIFALMDITADIPKVNLKCNPIDAEDLRDLHDEITPGYHMNKRHWNTVQLNGKLADALVYKMIDNSYTLVLKGMKKADREKIKNM